MPSEQAGGCLPSSRGHRRAREVGENESRCERPLSSSRPIACRGKIPRRAPSEGGRVNRLDCVHARIQAKSHLGAPPCQLGEVPGPPWTFNEGNDSFCQSERITR